MGLSPEVWGPNLWGTLHILCLTDTITPEFVQEYARVIPCSACATHFQALLTMFPFPDTDQFEWSVLIHNKVNERLKKPQFTVDQARTKWSSRPVPEFHYKIIILVHLIIITILFMVRK